MAAGKRPGVACIVWCILQSVLREVAVPHVTAISRSKVTMMHIYAYLDVGVSNKQAFRVLHAGRVC